MHDGMLYDPIQGQHYVNEMLQVPHYVKQGVALTGRNTTGPPCSNRGSIITLQAAWRHCLQARREVLQTTTDANYRY